MRQTMTAEIQAPQQPASRRAPAACNEIDARLYQSIPDHVGHVPHPDYCRPGTEKDLFGPQAPTIRVPRWRPALEVENAQGEPELPQARASFSRQDEVVLFRRYNCARHHLANLIEKQTRRFARGRVSEILTWYRRVLDNRAALTQANMALVVAMAKRVQTNTVEFGELVSEGNLALLRAMEKFDYSRGFKFSTYACCAILRSFGRLAAQAGTYRQRFPASFGPQMERSDELERRHDYQADLALEDLRRVLRLNQAGLTAVERTVLAERFAVTGPDRAHTLAEVGGLVRLSKERVRQVQKGALMKLRHALDLVSSAAPSRAG
jgi:RNA polymerase sigma factor (sigma-70 family)